ALHPLALHPDQTTTTHTGIPHTLEGITLHTPTPDTPTTLRVRLTQTGEHTLALTATDTAGAPVVSVNALTFRPQTRQARLPLHHVDWIAQPSPSGSASLALPLTRAAHLSLGTPPTAEERSEEPIAALIPATRRFGNADDLFRALGDGSPAPETAPKAATETPETPEAVLVSLPRSSEPADGPGDEIRDVLGEVLAFLQRWLADERCADVPLALLTERAVSVGPGEDPDPVGAALWGLVRTAQTEHPDRIIVLDLDGHPTSPTALPHALSHAVTQSPIEPHLAIREGRIRTPRLTRLAETPAATPTTWDPEGTVLITGGIGTLAAHTARHLVTQHRVGHLLLAGRTGPNGTRAQELKAELEELGATVTLAACDVADRKDLDALLASVPGEHPLCAVVHTAGVVDDATLATLTGEQLDAVLRPKVDGAWNLHQATRHLDLDAFVLFSSLAATVGSPGQANYAAANAYLDALAQHRHAHGLPATSLAWGPWGDERGMAGQLGEADAARIGRTGFPPLSARDALGLLDAALAVTGGAARPVLVCTALSIRSLRARAEGGTLPPLLSSLVGRPGKRAAAKAPSATAAGPSLAERLAGMDPAGRQEHLLDLVRRTTASILAYADVADVPAQAGFLDMGLDSLSTIDLRNSLRSLTGLQLSATIVFDHPTPAALARHLADRLAQDAGTAEPAVLQELHRLESSLAEIAAADVPLRTRVRDRLQALLTAFEGGPQNGQAEVTDALLSASAEEVLQFIDREFSDTLPASREAVSDDE
ncbi:SDR family NAD(P)-dependent oxidoreductase, partial [Streptomyces sp. NPDC058828]